MSGAGDPPAREPPSLVCFEGDAASLAAADRAFPNRTVAGWNRAVSVVPKTAATSLAA